MAKKKKARRVCAGEACAWRRYPRPSLSSCRQAPRAATATLPTRRLAGVSLAPCSRPAGRETGYVQDMALPDAIIKRPPISARAYFQTRYAY